MANMKPAPACPITGMLHLIGAGDKAVAPPADKEEKSPPQGYVTVCSLVDSSCGQNNFAF